MKKKLLLIFLLLTLTFIASFAFTGCNGCGSKSYSITITCSPEEGGSVTGQGTYKKGSAYILKATPNTNYVFDGWYMGESKLSENLQISGTMGSFDMQLIAKFNYVNPNRTLTIHFKDDLGVKIAEDKIITKKKGESYNVAIDNKVGYTVDKASLSGVLNDNETVTVTYTRKSYKLVINFIDEGNNVLGKVENNFRYGDSYSYDLKGKVDYYDSVNEKITGKIHQSNSAVSSQLNNATITLSAKFVAKTYTINFILKDTDGNILPNAEMPSVTKKYKESYAFTPIEITGYEKSSTINGTLTLTDSVFGEQLSNKTKNELTVTFEYALKDYVLKVNYVDENENVLGSEQKSYKFGDTYNFDLQNKLDYYESQQSNLTGVIDLNNQLLLEQLGNSELILNATFIPKTYKINFRLVDEEGLAIPNEEQQAEYKKYLEDYRFEPKVIDGWAKRVEFVVGSLTLNDKLLGEQLTNKQTELTITFTYVSLVKPRTIPVKYVDAKGVEIKTATTATEIIGNNCEINVSEIEDYLIDVAKMSEIYANNFNSSENKLSFTMISDENFCITLYYKIKTVSITINYLKEDGSVIATQYNQTIDYNSSYSVNSPTVKGYTPDKSVISGTVEKSDVVITVTYIAKKFKVTINYYYKGTTTVASPQKVFNSVAFGSTFTLASPEIEGYKPNIAVVSFVLNEESDKIINVYYEIQSYKLTVKYTSSVSGFTCPATVTKTVKYNEQYEIVSPKYYGLSVSQNSISGKKKACDEEFTVTYGERICTIYFNYFFEGTKIGVNSLQISFTDKTASINVPSVIISNGLGYKISYTKLEASIVYQNNQTTLNVYGIKSNSSKVDLKENLVDKIFIAGYAECSIIAEKITSTVTFKYIYDGNYNNVLETKTATGQYGEVIEIDRKSFGNGYVLDYEKTTYTFTDKNETINLNYTRIERTVKIMYFDDAGNEIAPSVKYTYKYNDQFNVVSPTIECYAPDKTSVMGTVQLSNLTYIVTYTVQWDLDENNALIIASVDDLVKLSRNSILWNRDITITQDLDLSSTTLNPIGNNEAVFSGNVKGNNFKIKNLSVTNENVIKKSNVVNGENVVYGYAGLFGCLSGSVSDLTIENAIINVNLGTTNKTTLYGGILCGLYSNNGTAGTIRNVKVRGTITVSAVNCVVGGIIGINSDIDSEIYNCTSNVTINDAGCEYAQVGGISGYEVMSNIHDCTVTITTTFVESGNVFVGGIAGESVNGVIHTNECNVSNVCGKQNSTIIY